MNDKKISLLCVLGQYPSVKMVEKTIMSMRLLIGEDQKESDTYITYMTKNSDVVG